MGKKVVYDIAAVRAAEAAKRGDTIEFRIGSKEFSIAAPGFMSDDVKRVAHDDRKFLDALLGDQAEDFYAAGGRSDDLALLFRAYADAQGSSLGE